MIARRRRARGGRPGVRTPDAMYGICLSALSGVCGIVWLPPAEDTPLRTPIALTLALCASALRLGAQSERLPVARTGDPVVLTTSAGKVIRGDLMGVVGDPSSCRALEGE